MTRTSASTAPARTDSRTRPVPAASTSASAAFTLHACRTPGGTVTATLMQGTTAAATATQDVTVTAAPPPPQHAPAPTGLSVDSSTQTSLSLSWSPVQDAHRYRLERSSNGVSGWSTVDDDISGTSHTLSGLSCATTVHFRVSARGDGTPYSTDFGDASAPSVSGTTSACTSTTTPITTPVTVTLTPRVEGSSTRVNITIQWNDPQTCNGRYLVALYTSASYMVQFLGYNAASETPSSQQV